MMTLFWAIVTLMLNVLFYWLKCSTDLEAPKITCPGNQTVNTEPSQAYAPLVWTDPQVTENSGQIPTITCDAESGSQFRIGETEVICQAQDPTGNQATCTFTVTIEGNVNWFWRCVFLWW